MTHGDRGVLLLQRLLLVGLMVTFGGAFAHAIYFSGSVPFIRTAGGPEWIGPPLTPHSNLVGVPADSTPAFVFTRRFDAPAGPISARLRVRGHRRFELRINDNLVLEQEDDGAWRQFVERDVGARLRAGSNLIEVSVRNRRGPPLLQLELALPDETLVSDRHWQVRSPRGDRIAPARPAKDTLAHPESRMQEQPGHVIGRHGLLLIALFLGGALAHALTEGRIPHRWQRRLPEIILGLVCLFWVALLATKLSGLTVKVGFDLGAHLIYIDTILDERRLPLAHEGFSNYHPPIFHALTAILVGLSEADIDAASGRVVYRLIPFLSGLSIVWLTYRVARQLWPDEALRPCLAIASAGLLPMNVYMSSYVSNESLHAALVSLALALCAGAMLAARASVRWLAGISVALGLALLTKFTSLLIAPIVIAFVGAKLYLGEGRPLGRSLLAMLGMGAGAASISGWFYLRNYIVFGDPVVWNLDVPGAPTWWMHPGFHTSEWYLRFGESLRFPYFAGFASFWDGVYSTFWGDGLLGGMIRISTRHDAWNYAFMTLTFWLAFPATVLIGIGYGKLCQHAHARGDIGRRLLLTLFATLVACLFFSLVRITFTLPFYAQAKAFYILAAALPLALISAEGLAFVPRRFDQPSARIARSAYFGWLGTLALVIVLAFLG